MSGPSFPSTLSCGEEPTSRLARRLSVAAMFSLEPRGTTRAPSLAPAADAAARALDAALAPGGISLVTGPSGAGKSSVLRRLELIARQRGPVIVVPAPGALLRERRTLLDLLHGGLHDDIRLLCGSGLAEAPLWLRPARVLSEGERWRLSLAMALGSARDAGDAAPTLIADEFASTLDRVSAMTLCIGVRRLLRARPDCRLVVVSAHDDLEAWLDPDLTMRIPRGFARDARFSLRRRGEAG